MPNELEKSIYQNMRRKSTDELKEILDENDTEVWSENALIIISKILAERQEIPSKDIKKVMIPSAKGNNNDELMGKTFNNVVSYLYGVAGGGIALLISYIISFLIDFSMPLNMRMLIFGVVAFIVWNYFREKKPVQKTIISNDVDVTSLSVKCSHCNNENLDDFEYDSYHGEFSCKECGSVVTNIDAIFILRKKLI